MLAKQLVNLRKQKTKNMAVSSRITAIGHQAQTMHSTAKMAGAMSTASKVLYGMFVCLGHVWVMFGSCWCKIGQCQSGTFLHTVAYLTRL